MENKFILKFDRLYSSSCNSYCRCFTQT